MDGRWGPWDDWGECSVTCGDGTSTRTRQCNWPAAQRGGAACTGDATETKPCSMSPCPGKRPLYRTTCSLRGGSKGARGGAAPPSRVWLPVAPKCSVKWLHCAMFCSSLVFVLHFLMLTIIEFYFVLMTSVYSQYLRDSCKQYLALIGS